MRKTLVAAAAALILSASPAWARQCPKDMAEIDAALAQNPQVEEATLVKVKELRARGEELHNAGNHPDSEAVLAEAKGLLGIK